MLCNVCVAAAAAAAAAVVIVISSNSSLMLCFLFLVNMPGADAAVVMGRTLSSE